MPSAIDLAKRALVSLLRTLAATYRVALTLQRDAPDGEVSRAYRRVSLKVCKVVYQKNGAHSGL